MRFAKLDIFFENIIFKKDKFIRDIKGCALIRANLGIDPTKGDYEDWAANYAQALWIEKWRLKNHAEMLAKMFGDVK